MPSENGHTLQRNDDEIDDAPGICGRRQYNDAISATDIFRTRRTAVESVSERPFFRQWGGQFE